jgi:hypothetical protein
MVAAASVRFDTTEQLAALGVIQPNTVGNNFAQFYQCDK